MVQTILWQESKYIFKKHCEDKIIKWILEYELRSKRGSFKDRKVKVKLENSFDKEEQYYYNMFLFPYFLLSIEYKSLIIFQIIAKAKIVQDLCYVMEVIWVLFLIFIVCYKRNFVFVK